VRNKVIYDTQIVSNAAAGRVPKGDWETVSKFISAKCRYCVSLNTLYELLAGLAGGDDAHFEENRYRLRLLCPPFRKVFLPLVGDFVRQCVFKKPLRRDDFSPQKIQGWMDIILSAKNKNELTAGLVEVNRPSRNAKTWGIDLDLILRQLKSGKEQHAQVLESLRRGVVRRSTPETWAGGVLRTAGISITPENAKKVLTVLDAVYRYDTFLWDLAEKQKYDFSQHDSDWLDSQQLYYLADPNVILVTSDRNLKHRTNASTQQNRIVTFDEFLGWAKRGHHS